MPEIARALEEVESMIAAIDEEIAELPRVAIEQRRQLIRERTRYAARRSSLNLRAVEIARAA